MDGVDQVPELMDPEGEWKPLPLKPVDARELLRDRETAAASAALIRAAASS